MHPTFLEIPLGPLGRIPIHAYGFMIVVGFLAASAIAIRRGRRDGVTSDTILDLGLVVMIAGIVGARITYIFRFSYEYDWSILDLTDGGISLPGILLGWALPVGWVLLRGRNRPKPDSTAGVMLRMGGTLAASVLGALLLGRGLHVLANRDRYSFGIFQIWKGGLVFYGGFILALVSAVVFVRKRKQSVYRVFDLMMPTVMLAYAFTRIGCFCYGCCYGAVTEVPWAVRFPMQFNSDGQVIGAPAFSDHLNRGLIERGADHSLPVHPTQIYQSAAALVLFFLLSAYWRRKKFEGEILGGGLMVYAADRFLQELLRDDEARLWGTGLTFSQLLGIPMFVLGLWIWWRARHGGTPFVPAPAGAAPAQTAPPAPAGVAA